MVYPIRAILLAVSITSRPTFYGGMDLSNREYVQDEEKFEQHIITATMTLNMDKGHNLGLYMSQWCYPSCKSNIQYSYS